jgi:plasmid stabilization system protein ParE
MKYKFHPEAQIEFSESVLYYSEKNLKLGTAFYTEIENVICKITKNPAMFTTIEEDIRRCLMKRFPYGVLYTIEEDYILILAVMHFSRDPSYWKHRIKKNK